ncbi:Uncharacterized protein K02A2.6, partial [Araneus ventricosus]
DELHTNSKISSRDHDLYTRLGLLLGDRTPLSGQKPGMGSHNLEESYASISSLASSEANTTNTSPLSTLTVSDSSDIDPLSCSGGLRTNSRDQSSDSVMSLMSTSTGHSSCSSPIGMQFQRHVPTRTSDSFVQFAKRNLNRRQMHHKSDESALNFSAVGRKSSTAKLLNKTLKPLYFEVPQTEPDPLFLGRQWLFKEIEQQTAELKEWVRKRDQAPFLTKRSQNSSNPYQKDSMANDFDPEKEIYTVTRCFIVWLREPQPQKQADGRRAEDQVANDEAFLYNCTYSRKGIVRRRSLSRNPQKVPYKREELEAEIDAFIQMITSSLPASSRRLDELRVAQLKDETCQKLTDYVLKGWPSKKEVDTLCAPYWQKRYEISVQDGLLMRGCRIIIPKSHQAEVMNQIHEGHLDITKCRARARCSVYWPGISKVIEEKIKSCTACIQESSNRHQPLIPTSFPERPWEVLGLDLFKYKNSWYLLISDYYTRYPEIARLDRLTSAEIINHCKSIFSRHGIPDVVRSDNGSQFDPKGREMCYKQSL